MCRSTEQYLSKVSRNFPLNEFRGLNAGGVILGATGQLFGLISFSYYKLDCLNLSFRYMCVCRAQFSHLINIIKYFKYDPVITMHA